MKVKFEAEEGLQKIFVYDDYTKDRIVEFHSSGAFIPSKEGLNIIKVILDNSCIAITIGDHNCIITDADVTRAEAAHTVLTFENERGFYYDSKEG